MFVILRRWIILLLISGILAWLGYTLVGPKTSLALGIGSFALQVLHEIIEGANRPDYTEDDFLAILSLTEWKRMLQISKEMMELRNVPSGWRGSPTIGWLFAVAERLLESGLIERRLGTDAHIIFLLGGRIYYEYRLTHDGQRRKDEIIERWLAERAQRSNQLSPQPNQIQAIT